MEPFPLRWPAGWPREHRRRRAPFKVQGFGRVRDAVVRNVELVGGSTNIVISSNVPTGSHGLPLAGAPEPRDAGVAVYWRDLRHAKPARDRVIACDRWDRVLHNLRAIELSLSAMRGLSRWGSTELVDRSFEGFAALPPAREPADWRAAFPGCVDLDQVHAEFRRLSRDLHPDLNDGRGVVAMQQLTAAYNAAKAELSPPVVPVLEAAS